MIIRTSPVLVRSIFGIHKQQLLATKKLTFRNAPSSPLTQLRNRAVIQWSSFHSSSARFAEPLTADAVMENLNDLYGTAKDEFEIAAEETEKNTTYAADDREAAKEAFVTLKEAYQQAIKESDPEVGKEIQSRVGQRIRELQNALTALEESAMES